MTRKLASIQKINKLEPINGADNIEKATVLGWELVVKKGEFKENDLCVYCEVDSVLPDRKEFEFLRERKFRIRTVKLKGQVSQGICFPLNVLPSYNRKMKMGYEENKDVTELLGVTKYESKSEIQERVQETVKSNRIQKFLKRYKWYRNLFTTKSKSQFPAFIKKTDEDRIQLFPNIYNDYKDLQFQVTEKVDGQSATYFVVENFSKKLWEFWKEDYIFGVCSRNFLLPKEDNSTWWRIAKQFDIKKKMLEYITSVNNVMGLNEYRLQYFVIQGEILGEGIQGNKYKVTGLDFYVFNVFDSYDTYNNIEQVQLAGALGLKCVPTINTSFDLLPTITENVIYSKGKSVLANIQREGIVVRNYNQNISFKIINPDFLLKYQDNEE